MTHAIKEISRHSSIYRGFLITRRPKTVISKIARYEVTLGEQSFGLFDAQAQATGYIDALYKSKVAFKVIGAVVINPVRGVTQRQLNEWKKLNEPRIK